MSFFNLVFLNCFSGGMSLQVSPLRVCFLPLKFYSFPGSIPHWFSKASILGVVFPAESVLCIRWPKYWSFSFSISPSNEYSRLIFFRMDCLDLLAVRWTLKSLLQHNSSKASILWHSAFFIVQLSHPYMTTGKTIALTRWTFVGKVMSLFWICYLGWSWFSFQGVSVF